MSAEYGMSIIVPTVITDAMLTSSTAPEPAAGEIAWTAVAWAAGAICYLPSTHTRYKAAVAIPAGGVSPDIDIANATTLVPAKWGKIGTTNRWGMLDDKITTLTTLNSPLTVVLRPGSVEGLGMMGIVGRQVTVTMKDKPGGTVVYYKVVNLDATEINSIYDWFFAEYEQQTDLVLTDMPRHYAKCELTVTLGGTGPVSCAALKVGRRLKVGNTEYGATAGMSDYTNKEADTFGNVDLVDHGFSRRNSLKVYLKKGDFNRVYRRLTDLRATLCVYIGTEDAQLTPLIVYGFYKDFSIEIPYPLDLLCNLEVEGIAT